MATLRPEDITRYRCMSFLKVSPGQRTAALVSARADLESNGYKRALWTLDTETEAVSRLTVEGDPKSFCFLDDDTILYTGSGTAQDQARVRRGELLTVVYAIPASGGVPRILCRIPLKNASIDRLQGGKLLVSTFHDNSRPDYESLPEAEKDEALAAYALESEWEVCDESPFWRDGKGIVDKHRTRLFTYDLASGRLEPVTEPWFDTLTYRVNQAGTRVAIVGERFTRRMDRMKGVYLYDVASGETRELLPDKGYQVSGVEFLGEKVMACAIPWNGYGPFPNHDLYEIDPAAGTVRSVHQHTAEDNGFKTCSDVRSSGGYTMFASGDTLYYIISYDNNTAINTWREGEGGRRITGDDFSPELLGVAGDKVFAVGFTGTRPQELYRVEGGSARRLSAFNEEIFTVYTPVMPEFTSFVNRDGVRIDGFVIYPADYERGKKYPGVLHIHGGPRQAYSSNYAHEMQLFSSHGYFVFFCNPRGSASRGEEFSALGDRRGTIDYEDIMAFTDHVLERYPDLDGERLGVTGISFGGFMTNWIIGHTGRFRAAVSCCSIVNNLSFFGVSDENSWGSLLAPWDNVQRGWDGSPLKYYRNVTTPTMFVQTYEDYRCPLSEAVQMYTALQIIGVDTRLCMFHGESHSLSRTGHPRNRVRRLRAILEWMDKYLKTT